LACAAHLQFPSQKIKLGRKLNITLKRRQKLIVCAKKEKLVEYRCALSLIISAPDRKGRSPINSNF
jgi:hypothetical protein